jgi:nicotinamide riboside transporter PnuC
MHWLLFFVLGPLAGWWAWRRGEKRRKRLENKVVLRRIVGSPILRRIVG